jgi:integrase
VRRPQILTNLQYLGPDLADLGRLAEHLRWVADRRLRAAVMVLMTTGVRVSELCAARVEELHPREGKFWMPVRRKGGYRDAVEMPRTTMEAVHLYLGGRTHGPMILGDHGGAISRSVVWRMVHRLGESVLPDLPQGLHPHDFRHAFVSAVLLLTGEITEAQWRAGHRDIQTTMGYVHALKAQESTTPARLEELFGLGLG